MSNLTTLNNTMSRNPSLIAATGPSNLFLNQLIHYMDNVLSAITNKDVLDSGTKLRDLVQPVSSDLSKLFEGISQGAKMLSHQKFSTSKLSTEAQTVALDVLRGVGNAHWAAIGLLVIANVLDRVEKISANDRECIDLLKAMLSLAKYMKQLKDNHFDLHREILEKMSEAVQLIVRGAILCHSFITSNKISKFLLTTKIREELVYVRGKVDSMKSDLILQMQVLIMSTLTFYISTNHTGGIDGINFLRVTEQFSSQQSDDIYDISGSQSETGFSSRQDNCNDRNGHRKLKVAPRTFLAPTRFLNKILPGMFRRRQKAFPYMEKEIEILVKKIQPTAIEFTRKELLRATKKFRKVLGKGGFGTVFFGTLYDGRKVAVKKSDIEVWPWANEMEVLTKTDHPNIMNLMGYCFKDDLMLVYEYMDEGNLSDFLGAESKQIIDWPARLRIILDVIRGLVYLHEGADACVVHRDIKPTNILLDKNFNAKISDFGISKILTNGAQYAQEQTWTDGGISRMLTNETQYAKEVTFSSTTRVAGTFGYAAPEYVQSGKLTKKADIYSFGVLLLHVVSGKRAVYHTDEMLELLSDHAWRLHRDDRLNELIDPRLVNGNGSNSTSMLRTSNDFNLISILRTITIALWCIQKDPAVRPSASRVLATLSSEDETPLPPVDLLSSVDEIPLPPVESHFDDDHLYKEDDYLSACDEEVGEIEEPTAHF